MKKRSNERTRVSHMKDHGWNTCILSALLPWSCYGHFHFLETLGRTSTLTCSHKKKCEALWKRLFCQVKIRARDVSIVLFHKHNMKNFIKRVVKCDTKNPLPLFMTACIWKPLLVMTLPSLTVNHKVLLPHLLYLNLLIIWSQNSLKECNDNSKNGPLHIKVVSLFSRTQKEKDHV